MKIKKRKECDSLRTASDAREDGDGETKHYIDNKIPATLRVENTTEHLINNS